MSEHTPDGRIDLTVRDGVGILTIDAPSTRNALTPEMSSALVAACQQIDDDASIGAAVVQGANGTFCSGADRRRWVAGADEAEDATYKMYGAIYAAFVRVGNLKVPTISAVTGSAVGAGLNLMLATDLRIVASDAKLLAGFLKIGLHPGGGFFTIANRAAGREATAALGIFSEQISGARAAEIGLAWEAVDAADVQARAFELAARPALDPELAREAVRSMRTEIGPPGMTWEGALPFERSTQMWSQRRRNAT